MLVSGESMLPGVQMATFSPLCLYMASSLCAHGDRDRQTQTERETDLMSLPFFVRTLILQNYDPPL